MDTNRTEYAEGVVAHTIDLKWSLWTAHVEDFPADLQADWAKLQAGEITEIQISTAPKKEIRFGTVRMRKGFAVVQMSTRWDDVESLADTLKVDPDALWDHLAESGALEDGDVMGGAVEERVEGETLEALVEAIDDVEDQLIEEDAGAWTALEAWAKEQPKYTPPDE
jgi:hypothetical protein